MSCLPWPRVRAADGSLDRHLSLAHSDRPGPGAVAHRHPLGSCLPRGPASVLTSAPINAPITCTPAPTGVGLVQLAGQGGQLGSASRVQLAPRHHRVVEHVQHRPAQRLGPVQHGQNRPGDVPPPLAQVQAQRGDQGGVLGRI